MRSEALVFGINQEAPVVKVPRCSCELVKCRLNVVIVVWMMTYLENSGNIPYMQGTQMAADGGRARGWYGFGSTTSLFRRVGSRSTLYCWNN